MKYIISFSGCQRIFPSNLRFIFTISLSCAFATWRLMAPSSNNVFSSPFQHCGSSECPSGCSLKFNRQTNKPPKSNDRHNLNMKYNYHSNSIPQLSGKAKGDLKGLETLEFLCAQPGKLEVLQYRAFFSPSGTEIYASKYCN